MNGNIHVQFLGEGVAATSPPYPTPRGAIPWGDPAFFSPVFPTAEKPEEPGFVHRCLFLFYDCLGFTIRFNIVGLQSY